MVPRSLVKYVDMLKEVRFDEWLELQKIINAGFKASWTVAND